MTYLRSKTESVSVREPRAGIVEHACTIDFPLEVGGPFVVLGNDDIGVPAAVFVNMIYRVIKIRHDLDSAFKGPVLGPHAFRGRRPERQQFPQFWAGIDLHLEFCLTNPSTPRRNFNRLESVSAKLLQDLLELTTCEPPKH